MRRFSGELRARERDRRRARSLERARLRELVAGGGGAPRVVGFGVAPDHPQDEIDEWGRGAQQAARAFVAGPLWVSAAVGQATLQRGMPRASTDPAEVERFAAIGCLPPVCVRRPGCRTALPRRWYRRRNGDHRAGSRAPGGTNRPRTRRRCSASAADCAFESAGLLLGVVPAFASIGRPGSPANSTRPTLAG
jgi:hypothetical protein